MLVNAVEKKIDYLRISVTDRCNLRCTYCMPAEGIENVDSDELLSFEEILRLVNIFADLGIKKIRITGGEPLVRNGIIDLIKSIAGTKGIEEIALTTNSVLLPNYADRLKEAGVDRLNISLDTLKENKFHSITRSAFFRHAMDGIDKAIQTGFRMLKLNCVVMRGINDDEITDFIEFAKSKNLILRFIEFMKITPLWEKDLFMPLNEIKEICRKTYNLEQMDYSGPSPAEHYKVDGMSILGFIRTDQNNCSRCSRLRLTPTGKLKICLYENEGLSLKELLRRGIENDELLAIIKERMASKNGVVFSSWEPAKMYMCSFGG